MVRYVLIAHCFCTAYFFQMFRFLSNDVFVLPVDLPLVSSEWFGNQNKDGNVHEFMFSDEEEKLISLDVRAGSWVDSIKFHSSKQSSVWIGGTGGNLHNLKFDGENELDGLFGTAGDHVTSIGIKR